MANRRSLIEPSSESEIAGTLVSDWSELQEQATPIPFDTPEVYFGTECYGPQASAVTKRLLPPGTRVLLAPEPATDRIDQYGRLLRYVIRDRDGLYINVNVRLVEIGAAAPYFYRARRGEFAELQAGQLKFASRETGNPARLVLTIQG